MKVNSFLSWFSKFVLVAVFVFVMLAFSQITPVLALGFSQAEQPATQVAELNGEFLFFLITLTGFIQNRTGWKGNTLLALAFFVGLFLYLSPLFLPILGDTVNLLVNFVKWFIASAGSIDTAVYTGGQVAKLARLSPKG